MTRIIAAVLAVIALAIAGWALVYLPGQMSTEAEKALADFKRVLEESAPKLTLTHGAVSGNAMTASVSVADVSLAHADGGTLTADDVVFSVDPLSRQISAVEARALTIDRGRAQAKIATARIDGLTPETVSLLGLAADKRITPGTLFERLVIERFSAEGLSAATRGEGELTVRSIAVEGLRGGKVSRFALEGFDLHSRAVQNPGEFLLRSVELRELDIGQISRMAADPMGLPAVISPVFEGFAFNHMEMSTPEMRVVVGGGALDATYAINASGGKYANRATFTIDGIVVEPRSGNQTLREFGLSRIDADVKMVVTGDHAAQTMAVEEMSFRFAELADINFGLVFADVPAETFKLSHTPEEVMAMAQTIGEMSLKSASVVFSNTRLVQLSLAYMERKQGIDAKALVAQLLAEARGRTAASGDVIYGRLVDELERFLADPRMLAISVAPPQPLSLSRIQSLSQGDQGQLSRALNLKIKAN